MKNRANSFKRFYQTHLFVSIILITLISAVAGQSIGSADSLAFLSADSNDLKLFPLKQIQDIFIFQPGVTDAFYLNSVYGSRPEYDDILHVYEGIPLTMPIGYAGSDFRQFLDYTDTFVHLPLTSIHHISLNTMDREYFRYAKSGYYQIKPFKETEKVDVYFRLRKSITAFTPDELLTEAEAEAEAKMLGTNETNQPGYVPPSQMAVEANLTITDFSLHLPVKLSVMKIPGWLHLGFSMEVYDQGGFLRGQNIYRQAYLGNMNYTITSDFYFKFQTLHNFKKTQPYKHPYSRMVSTGEVLLGYNVGDSEPYPVTVGSVVTEDGTLIPVTNYDMLNNTNRPRQNSRLNVISVKKMFGSNFSIEIKYADFYSDLELATHDPADGSILRYDNFSERRFFEPMSSIYFPPNTPTAETLESYWWVLPMVVEKRYFRTKQGYRNWQVDFNARFWSQNLTVLLSSYNYDLFIQEEMEYEPFFVNEKPSQYIFMIKDKIQLQNLFFEAALSYNRFNPNSYRPGNFEDPFTDDVLDPGSPLYDRSDLDFKYRYKNPIETTVKSWYAYSLLAGFNVTESTQFQLNLNRSYSMPPLYFLYRYMNPDLGPEKVNIISLSFLDNTWDWLHSNLRFYQKRSRGCLNFLRYVHWIGFDYYVPVQKSEVEISGISAALRFNILSKLHIDLKYLYQKAEGSFQYTIYDPYHFFDPDALFGQIRPVDWDIRHTINAGIVWNFKEGNEWVLGSVHPLANFSISTLIHYHTGLPYTVRPYWIAPPDQSILLVNDHRLDDYFNIDLKLLKYIRIYKSLSVGFSLEFYNLLNQRQIWHIDDTTNYLGSDEGDGPKNDPTVWELPMHVLFGVEVKF